MYIELMKILIIFKLLREKAGIMSDCLLSDS